MAGIFKNYSCVNIGTAAVAPLAALQNVKAIGSGGDNRNGGKNGNARSYQLITSPSSSFSVAGRDRSGARRASRAGRSRSSALYRDMGMGRNGALSALPYLSAAASLPHSRYAASLCHAWISSAAFIGKQWA
jgi:hypothetical protein